VQKNALQLDGQNIQDGPWSIRKNLFGGRPERLTQRARADVDEVEPRCPSTSTAATAIGIRWAEHRNM